MKLTYRSLLLIVFAYGCTFTPREEALSNVKEYTDQLKEIAADSTKQLDTAKINAEYDKNILSINSESMKDIKGENSFMELLKTEKSLLLKWKPITGFTSYFGKRPDTLLKLIRRCSAFDRAPLSAERTPASGGMRSVSQAYYKVQVPIAFHFIVNRKGNGLQGNMITRVNDQISALNNVYNKFNISFKLISTDTTRNDAWFDKASYYIDSNALYQMTKSLSRNPGMVMNVYTLNSQVLGESTFPWYNDKGTSRDYVVMNYNTLPGGPATFVGGIYNQGKTLIHEAGHFLGLFHTFEGGNQNCQSPNNNGCGIGDQVDDTPAQKICYFTGCDENVDSCPDPGKDPVRNYMGYNPDACMTQITPGQGDRLIKSILRYRSYFITNPI